MKIEAKARLQAAASDKDLLIELAKASHEEISPSDVIAAKKVGDKIVAYGPDGEGGFIVFTFNLKAGGKKGAFGGSPDSSHPNRAGAAAAWKKLTGG